MTRLTRHFTPAVAGAALGLLTAPANAQTQTAVAPAGTIPVCVAALTQLHYSTNAEGQCYRGHSLIHAADGSVAQQVADVRAANTALAAQVEALRGTIPAGGPINDRLTALEATVAGLTGRLDALEGTVNNVQAQFQAQLAAHQAQTDQRINDLTARLDSRLADRSLVSPDGRFTVSATNDGATLSGPGGTVAVTLTGTAISATQDVQLSAGRGVAISATKQVTLVSGEGMSLTSGPSLTMVTQGAASLSGASVGVTASATTTIKGAVVGLNTGPGCGGFPVARKTDPISDGLITMFPAGSVVALPRLTIQEGSTTVLAC